MGKTILALNMATIRAGFGMSQADFATLVGATRVQVSNWERGRTAVPSALLPRLSELSGVDMHRLSVEELPRGSVAPLPAVAPPPAVTVAAILLEIKHQKERLTLLEDMVRQLGGLPKG